MIQIQLPPEIVLEQGGILAADWQVTSEELRHAGAFGEKRRREYLSGRHYAHRALGRFLPDPSPLATDIHRCPVWPEGMVGGISHTWDYCAVAVASRSSFAGIGLDVEVIASFTDRIEAKVCTGDERAALARHPFPDRKTRLGLIFSAKEAFYKFQFPITKSWAGFMDVTSAFDQEGGCSIRLSKNLGTGFNSGDAFIGRYAFTETHVFALVHGRHPGGP